MTHDGRHDVTGGARHGVTDGARHDVTGGARHDAVAPQSPPVAPVSPPRPIRAAGCVLWRRVPDGDGPQIALVHRPKYGDWSLPKGKLKRGEGFREAAVRETLEETGMTCELGPELPTVRYLVDGRPKEVRYWAAEATGGNFIPNREVDRVIWLPPAAARNCLTQERDRELVDALLDVLGGAGDVR